MMRHALSLFEPFFGSFGHFCVSAKFIINAHKLKSMETDILQIIIKIIMIDNSAHEFDANRNHHLIALNCPINIVSFCLFILHALHLWESFSSVHRTNIISSTEIHWNVESSTFNDFPLKFDFDRGRNCIFVACRLPETVDQMCRRLCRLLKCVDLASVSKRPRRKREK